MSNGHAIRMDTDWANSVLMLWSYAVRLLPDAEETECLWELAYVHLLLPPPCH